MTRRLHYFGPWIYRCSMPCARMHLKWRVHITAGAGQELDFRGERP